MCAVRCKFRRHEFTKVTAQRRAANVGIPAGAAAMVHVPKIRRRTHLWLHRYCDCRKHKFTFE